MKRYTPLTRFSDRKMKKTWVLSVFSERVIWCSHLAGRCLRTCSLLLAVSIAQRTDWNHEIQPHLVDKTAMFCTKHHGVSSRWPALERQDSCIRKYLLESFPALVTPSMGSIRSPLERRWRQGFMINNACMIIKRTSKRMVNLASKCYQLQLRRVRYKRRRTVSCYVFPPGEGIFSVF